MRRKTTITGLFSASLVALALAASGSVAPAGAVTQSQLEQEHGWSCIIPDQIVPGTSNQPHCARSRGLARFLSEEARTLKMFVFDTSGEFLGTEMNVRGDIFHDQDRPCPTDPSQTDPPTYEYTHLLPVFGLDYYACHRFDSDHL